MLNRKQRYADAAACINFRGTRLSLCHRSLEARHMLSLVPMFSAAWSCAGPAKLAIHLSIAHHPFDTFFNMTLIDGSTIQDLHNSGELLEHNISTQPHSTVAEQPWVDHATVSPHAALQSSHLVTCIHLTPIMARLQPHFLNARIISAVTDAKHRRLFTRKSRHSYGNSCASTLSTGRPTLPAASAALALLAQSCLRANSLLVRFFFATSRGQHPALRPCVEMVACFAWR